MLPNLIIIGAGKAGTTSLHAYLDRHPQIGMSAVKELNYFNDARWRQRRSWYEAQFSGAYEIRGEASPAYSMHPYLPGVVERMYEVVPDARLIYLVREPIERAIAHYVEWVALRLEQRPLATALGDFGDVGNPYLCASRYWSQIEHYLARFRRNQILVLSQNRLRNERRSTLAEVLSFLGVDPDFWCEEFETLHNMRAEKRRYRRLGITLMRRDWFTTGEPRPGRRRPLIAPLRSLLSTPIDAAIDPALRDRLQEYFRPELEALLAETGVDLRPVSDG